MLFKEEDLYYRGTWRLPIVQCQVTVEIETAQLVRQSSKGRQRQETAAAYPSCIVKCRSSAVSIFIVAVSVGVVVSICVRIAIYGTDAGCILVAVVVRHHASVR